LLTQGAPIGSCLRYSWQRGFVGVATASVTAVGANLYRPECPAIRHALDLARGGDLTIAECAERASVSVIGLKQALARHRKAGETIRPLSGHARRLRVARSIPG
jgi:hypothetical protein